VSAVALCLLLTACARKQAPFSLHDISGLMPALQFNLTDQDGKAVTAADYRGKILLLYFGYTSCPDACPTTLATLSSALRNLGPDATRTRVLFVSVDPKRDSAALLGGYLRYFGPQFVGLRSDDDGPLDALTKRYRVAYHRGSPDGSGNYAVDHSSAVFIFDREGKPRLLGSGAETPTLITNDLRRLINSP
jgi:protein SCO1/2